MRASSLGSAVSKSERVACTAYSFPSCTLFSMTDCTYPIHLSVFSIHGVLRVRKRISASLPTRVDVFCSALLYTRARLPAASAHMYHSPHSRSIDGIDTVPHLRIMRSTSLSFFWVPSVSSLHIPHTSAPYIRVGSNTDLISVSFIHSVTEGDVSVGRNL